MSRLWSPVKGRNGTVLQSALAKQRPSGGGAQRANGLNLKGVVIGIHNYDSDSFMDAASPLDDNSLNAVYVTVLCYGRINAILPRVLWTQERSGIHEGRIRNPRAAEFDITGSPLNVEQGTNPANMDGDHVIVAFLEDDLLQPFVQRCIPHPSADKGNDSRILGHRMRTLEADGQVSYEKHRGSFYGINEDGNLVIDLTRAHVGQYEPDGTEPDPAEDGTSGNVSSTLPKKATVDHQLGEETTIIVKMGANIELTFTEIDGKLLIQNTGDTELQTDGNVKIGTGASHPVVHGDTYSDDHSAFLGEVQKALTACAVLWTAVAGWMIPFDTAQGGVAPATEPAVTALITALAAVGLTPGAAPVKVLDIISGVAGAAALDTALPGELSADVTSK